MLQSALLFSEKNIMPKLEEQLRTDNEIAIPRLIHFTWAGKERLMPEENLRTLLLWANLNPSFQVILWIDRTSYRGDQCIEERYRSILRNVAQDMGWSNYREEQIELRDIVEFSLVSTDAETDFIRYEIERLRPNYGASSDLLRYRILKYGGVYFDSDVRPNVSTSLENLSLFKEKLSHHRLFVDNHSQGTDAVGNDAFIVTANNPMMELIHDIAMTNYSARQLSSERCKQIETISFLGEAIRIPRKDVLAGFFPSDEVIDYDDVTWHKGFIEKITPIKTGTFCVHSFTGGEKGENIGKEIDMNGYKFIPVLSIPQKIFSIKINDGNWLRQPIRRLTEIVHQYELSSQKVQDTIFQVVLSTIIFEIKELGIFRLEDHITNIIESIVLSHLTQHFLNQQTFVYPEIADFFNIERVVVQWFLSKLDLTMSPRCNIELIEAVQPVFRYPAILEFYQRWDLVKKLPTCLDKMEEESSSFKAMSETMDTPHLRSFFVYYNNSSESLSIFESYFITPLQKYRLVCDTILIHLNIANILKKLDVCTHERRKEIANRCYTLLQHTFVLLMQESFREVYNHLSFIMPFTFKSDETIYQYVFNLWQQEAASKYNFKYDLALPAFKALAEINLQFPCVYPPYYLDTDLEEDKKLLKQILESANSRPETAIVLSHNNIRDATPITSILQNKERAYVLILAFNDLGSRMTVEQFNLLCHLSRLLDLENTGLRDEALQTSHHLISPNFRIRWGNHRVTETFFSPPPPAVKNQCNSCWSNIGCTIS